MKCCLQMDYVWRWYLAIPLWIFLFLMFFLHIHAGVLVILIYGLRLTVQNHLILRRNTHLMSFLEFWQVNVHFFIALYKYLKWNFIYCLFSPNSRQHWHVVLVGEFSWQLEGLTKSANFDWSDYLFWSIMDRCEFFFV